MRLFHRTKGDQSVPWDTAFEQYHHSLFRYFRFRGADADTANDLASCTFERAWRNRARYDPRKSQIQTWLFTIARNLAINHWKSEAVRSFAPLAEDFVAPDDPVPEEVLLLSESRDEISQALQSLDARAREIIALKFGGPLTNRQIAGLTGLSEQNVGVILYRSLLKLRSVLTASEEAPHGR